MAMAPDRTPPFDLPWRHFVAALVALPVGFGLLAWAGPEAIANPRGPLALGAVHLLALGWIAMVVMGALTQMVPVVLGVKLASHRAIAVSHALTLLGLLGLAGGFLARVHPAVIAGGLLAALGIGTFAATLGLTVWRARKRDLTTFTLAASTVHLVLGIGLGAAMALNQRWGFSSALYTAMPVHLHLLLVGWLSLLTAGISYKLLPMFSLAYGHPPANARRVVGLLALGTWLWAPVLIWPQAWWLPAAVTAAGALLYASDAFQLLGRRKKRRLDTGLALAASALALAPLLAVLGLGAGLEMPGWGTAYGYLLIAGWITWTLVGYLYKIIPFIVWYHRFGHAPAGTPRPLAGELVDARLARLAHVLLAFGVLGTTGALLAQAGAIAQAFAVVSALGAGLAALDLLLSVYRHQVAPASLSPLQPTRP